jgi:hypothetical protein
MIVDERLMEEGGWEIRLEKGQWTLLKDAGQEKGAAYS